ncbi:hypothetical protein [Zhihengliuella halotolerans]|uniref:hypothetical protein n=1 Tax=Zhihengliuella halotolerans TaxID=370736 RepID=UPI000C80FA34|nr:hypothetical protein [Zhihengliuella halotolerans]
MPNNVCIPYFVDPKDASGLVAGAPVVGKTFVSFVAGGTGGLPHVSTAAADTVPNAVAAYDQVVGKAVHLISAGHVPVTVGADVVPGDRVKVGADGRAVKIAATGEEHLAIGTVYVGAATGADAAIFLSL